MKVPIQTPPTKKIPSTVQGPNRSKGSVAQNQAKKQPEPAKPAISTAAPDAKKVENPTTNEGAQGPLAVGRQRTNTVYQGASQKSGPVAPKFQGGKTQQKPINSRE